MKRLFIFGVLVAALSARADQAASEPPLSAEDKSRIERTLSDAVKDGHITKRQYDQEVAWLRSTPCDGVDRSLSEVRKAELEAAIAKQEKLKAVTVTQSFKVKSWSIIYIENYVSDEPYLFYSRNPATEVGPIASWSGAAMIFETSEMKQWVLQNVPGIPPKLASCFAWHVTLNRI